MDFIMKTRKGFLKKSEFKRKGKEVKKPENTFRLADHWQIIEVYSKTTKVDVI